MHILVKKFVEDEKTMELFKSMVEKYCTSEKNHSQCACFKLFKQSIHPPNIVVARWKEYPFEKINIKERRYHRINSYNYLSTIF